jgi:hypothetical protein
MQAYSKFITTKLEPLSAIGLQFVLGEWKPHGVHWRFSRFVFLLHCGVLTRYCPQLDEVAARILKTIGHVVQRRAIFCENYWSHLSRITGLHDVLHYSMIRLT